MSEDLKKLRDLITSDAYRYIGSTSWKKKIKLFFRTPGFNYSCKMRFVKYCSEGRVRRVFFPIAYWLYRTAMFKYGIAIPYQTSIGYGFYIGHYGGIVVNSNVKIGNNVNISHGVTIGQAGKNGDKKCPIVMDEVYIGPNSTIVGGITISSNAAVGANAFVNKDVLPNVSVGGVPAKMISDRGSKDYVHNRWEGVKK